MVDKSKLVPLGELTAYERWELPNIGDPAQEARRGQSAPAKKIKPPTADQIETITKQAYDAGFEEGHAAGFSKGSEEGHAHGHAEGLDDGHKQGHEQGIAQAQQEIDERVARLEQQLAQLVDPISRQQRQVEEAILNVAVAVSRAVIHRELSVDSSSILKGLSAVLEDLPALDQGCILRVNEQDQTLVQSQLEKLNAKLELISDPSVTPGGFLLKTSNQLIDYTIEKRFQKTVQGMLSSAVNSKGEALEEVPSSIDSLSDFSATTLNEFEQPDPSADALDSTSDLAEQEALDETEQEVPGVAEQEALDVAEQGASDKADPEQAND